MLDRKQNQIGSVRVILATVAEDYRITVDQLNSFRRADPIEPRDVAIFLARDMTALTYPQLRPFFGDRDHTTLVDAVRRMRELVGESQPIRDRVERLREAIKERLHAEGTSLEQIQQARTICTATELALDHSTKLIFHRLRELCEADPARVMREMNALSIRLGEEIANG